MNSGCQRRRQRQRKQRHGFEEHQQDFSTCEAEELVAVSRHYSHSSNEMAKIMTKADDFAVSVDNHKCSYESVGFEKMWSINYSRELICYSNNKEAYDEANQEDSDEHQRYP